ncbi:hypothetical protein H6F93_11270 [Leptolyngbya sp. FACHB-671]|uniref:hypothetical protein n=1 Tax=Leptolyngbya sp. FACHB-671 TaxID=2692812 RepID=UPI001683D72F|nr:hypothetical protein [Leptolyngbya sp. FACHB-671]MBD2068097.1 hypothetical protein [Leptolyngbya sp. FACHB-671]
MAKHNWQVIKDEYVQAPDEKSRPTLEQLAAKYTCSPSYLREKAAKEHWKVEAERFVQTVSDKRQEHKSTALAGDLAAWDAQCYELAKGGLNLVFVQIKEATEGVAKGNDLPSPKQLDELAKALERLQKIGKTALGEKEETKLNVKIDYSNLSDEQLERLAAGENPRNVLAVA